MSARLDIVSALILFAAAIAMIAAREPLATSFALPGGATGWWFPVALVGLVSAASLTSDPTDQRSAVRQALSWLGVGVVAAGMLGWSLDGGRLLGRAPPPAPAAESAKSGSREDLAVLAPAGGGQAAALAKAQDGHFWAESNVNGVRIRFMVDTGASIVALTPDDALRAGVALDKLAYTVDVRTANGVIQAAYVTLESVQIAQIRLEDVQAVVVPQGLETSLLGMSFLGRLQRFEASQNTLILRL